MVRLVLNPDTQARVQTFDKETVVIGSASADILVPDEGIEERHVVIVCVDGQFFAHNAANDPFAMVNDLPFGKALLKDGDILHVGSATIRFEEGVALKVQPTRPPHTKEEEAEAPFEEESNARFFMILALVVVSLTMVIASSIYFSVSEQRDEEEMFAAEGVSDIAMALAYAKLHQMTPQKQSWSDPSFLNKALHAVVASEYPSAAKIDMYGKFADLPYILRIYTNSDLSQFLVIAQPVPSLLNWLIPKKTVIVDSATMEIRKLSNLRDLNRLLINLNNPNHDEDSQEVVTSFVKQETQIPLNALGYKKVKKGFVPPEMLGATGKGAEDLIYNAPRYYPFSENILDEVLYLVENPGDSKKHAQLRESLGQLMRYPHIVLYSSKGKEVAREAKRALVPYVPQEQLLVGYVDLDESGQIRGSYLLDGEEPESSLEVTEVPPLQEVDHEHPLYLHFTQLLKTREEALSPISEELEALMHAQNTRPVDHFWERYQKVLLSYLESSLEQQQSIVKEVIQCNQEMHALPFSAFYSYIQATGLTPLLHEYVKSHGMLTAEEFEQKLAGVQAVGKLEELQPAVEEMAGLLTLKTVPDPESLLAYQNTFRLQVHQKLSQFLFSENAEEFCASEARDLLLSVLDSSWITDEEERHAYLDKLDIMRGQSL